MLEIKTQAPPIFNLHTTQRASAVRTLMLKISVITGWTIPQSEIKGILAEQFEKLLVEKYPILNVVEIEFAFRQFGTQVSDWGKEMNLSLITEVLNLYQYDRREASRSALESSENAFKMEVMSEEDMDNEIRGKIEVFYQLKLEGRKAPLWLDHWAEVLVKDRYIKDISQVIEFFNWCLERNITNIYKKD